MNMVNPTVLKNRIVNSIKSLMKYYDIGYILNHLESLIILPVNIKNQKQTMEQYKHNKEIYNQTYLEATKAYEDFLCELESRAGIFKYIRTIKPDFCLNMNTKMSPEDQNRYQKLLRGLSKDIVKISFFLRENNDNYDELLLSEKDVFSSIIDSPDNSELANIEDSFLLSELNSIKLETITDSDMLTNILQLKSELKQRLKKHELYDKLNSKENKIVLRLGKHIPADNSVAER